MCGGVFFLCGGVSDLYSMNARARAGGLFNNYISHGRCMCTLFFRMRWCERGIFVLFMPKMKKLMRWLSAINIHEALNL